MEYNKNLINLILKNKIYLGNYTINKDVKNFISGINNKNGRVTFDLFKQMIQIRKVTLFLRSLKKKKRPILFFGINQFGLDSKNKSTVLFINRLIHNLCFSIFNSKDKNKIESKINGFYDLIYKEKTKNFPIDYKNYTRLMDLLIKNKKMYLNGHFFDTWVGGLVSNYHYLMPSLEKSFKEKTTVEDPFFFDNLKNLNNLSFFLDEPKNFPGAVIFFSKEGYEHSFKELKKLGIPVICIVNSNESLKNIDFPLFGDTSSLNTIIFYQKIIKNSLERI